MVQTDLLQVAELDFVCSVLADPAQFREIQHITPDVLTAEIPKAIWSVVYPLLSNKGAASATYVYGELANFEAGRKVGCPVLLLWGATGGVGRNHKSGPAEIWRNYATNITSAQALPCGHYLSEEAPKETTEALRAFFSAT